MNMFLLINLLCHSSFPNHIPVTKNENQGNIEFQPLYNVFLKNPIGVQKSVYLKARKSQEVSTGINHNKK